MMLYQALGNFVGECALGTGSMDWVDEDKGEYCNDIKELGIDSESEFLLNQIITDFCKGKYHVKLLERGLSKEQKFILKPDSLFPLFVKIGTKDRIDAEFSGQKLCELRMPAWASAPALCLKHSTTLGALAFRYMTQGLVSEPVSRLDFFVAEKANVDCVRIVHDIFDTVLRKCHWLDGHVVVKPYEPRSLPNPQKDVDLSAWSEICDCFIQFSKKCAGVRAPYAITHGDLHSKNILVARNDLPIIIDFSNTASDTCVYRDFARFEISIQFHVAAKTSDQFWHVAERIYGSDSLVLPRSTRPLASTIMAARSILWKACLSKSVNITPHELELGYRLALLQELVFICSKFNIGKTTRDIAIREVKALSQYC